MLDNLKTFFPVAEQIYDKKTTFPILHHLCVRDGILSMTNLDIFARMPVDDSREFTIPFTVLKNILKSKPGKLDVSVSDDRTLTLTYDGKKVSVPGLDPTEYPDFPAMEITEAGIWTQDLFRQLADLIPFASTDELHMYINGVHVNQNGTLSACATDGYSIRHIGKLDPNGHCVLHGSMEATIPANAVRLLAKCVKGNASVGCSGDYLRFSLCGNIDILARTVEGKFPDFMKHLTRNLPGSVRLSKKGLLLAIKEAKPFMNPQTGKGNLTVQNGTVTLSTYRPDENIRFETALDAHREKGDPAVIGFNLSYLEKTVKSIDGDPVLWQYQDSATRCLFLAEDPDESDTVNLLMPIKQEEGT